MSDYDRVNLRAIAMEQRVKVLEQENAELRAQLEAARAKPEASES